MKIWQENKETFFDEVQATRTFGAINEWNVIHDKMHDERFAETLPSGLQMQMSG